jgi:hypothetical protein
MHEGKRGGRSPKYGKFIKVLTAIWYNHERPCGKLLVSMIRGIIAFLEGERGYGIMKGLRDLLVEVSPVEADITAWGGEREAGNQGC